MGIFITLALICLWCADTLKHYPALSRGQTLPAAFLFLKVVEKKIFTAFFILKRRISIMSILGKQIRLERIINRNTRRTVIVPMDHGMSIGPIPGLINVRDAIQKVSEGGANACLLYTSDAADE